MCCSCALWEHNIFTTELNAWAALRYPTEGMGLGTLYNRVHGPVRYTTGCMVPGTLHNRVHGPRYATQQDTCPRYATQQEAWVMVRYTTGRVAPVRYTTGRVALVRYTTGCMGPGTLHNRVHGPWYALTKLRTGKGGAG